ncbi:ABC transporter permease [Prolixibacteraceae bacterium Z1-6]|uniref:ABC transporter permease n=1 Tax=Draconibacterium aestuarii TaxID=2998507 RepID=A0A9X3J3C6_9BACT|nr:ABC transporter permease [Prolixibacteraceae bacterium Z1-6]
MFKLIFKTAIRSILKDKYQSALNIFGLILGFAAFLFIASYFFHEYSFDRFNTKADRIYRCVTKVRMGDTQEALSTSETPLAITTKENLPEVEDATRIYFRKNVLVTVGEHKYVEKNFWYADANVFRIFDFPLLKGNQYEVLAKPNTVVITLNFSEKYFGNADAIGKSIELNDGELYEVTGILDKIPGNSHLQFDMLASFSSVGFSSDYDLMRWGNFRDMFTYVLLQENTDLNKMNNKLQELIMPYYIPMMERNGMSYDDFTSAGNFVEHSLQPLKQVHLNTTFTDSAAIYGNKQLLYALGFIGIMIILIACFNFINLTTARASLRAKEIGIKKIVGSGKGKIIVQVLFETFLQCFVALLGAVVMLSFGLSVLNSYVELNIQFSQFFAWQGMAIMLAILLFVVAMAGIFPSFVIARFNPNEIIKGLAMRWNTKSGYRNVLVSFQFVIFIALIACTIIVKKQVSLLHHQNPGFHKENILVVKNAEKLGTSRQAFKQEIEKNPDVIGASYTNSLPSMFDGSSNPFSKTDKKNQIFLYRVDCDTDFLNTLQIKLLDGRNFKVDAGGERFNAIINKKAAEAFGWTDCDNKVIYDFNNGGNNFNVIGIVEDFHIESLRETIEPMIIRYQETGSYLAVRIRPESAHDAIEKAKSIWGSLNNKTPFEFSFLDESFDNQYKQEVRFGKLVSLFSIISIVIACLGLLGLVSFTLLRKQKEIGIRKVNGANVAEVLAMLNKDFVRWVAVAFMVAIPISYYTMHLWLENFAYKTKLSWWIFALAGMLALGIALLTVSWQSWRAATRNPVEALRYE